MFHAERPRLLNINFDNDTSGVRRFNLAMERIIDDLKRPALSAVRLTSRALGKRSEPSRNVKLHKVERRRLRGVT